MGFETHYSGLARVNREAATAQRWLKKVEALREEALRKLPRHRELIGKIREYGLQVI
jgi:tryptophan halogenase